jgi:hypothetical protein
MGRGLLDHSEDAGGLNNVVNPSVSPLDLGGVLLEVGGHVVAIDLEGGGVLLADGALPQTVGRVVLEEVDLKD